MRQILGEDNYIRLQANLPSESENVENLDNVTDENLKILESVATDLIQNNQKLIEKVCDLLNT